jgi:hypothetical protein
VIAAAAGASAARGPRRALGWVALVLGTLAAGTHLGLTWLYNAPDNVAKVALDAPLRHYFGKLLYQNWSFFAPNPIDRDTGLYARGRAADGHETPWVDVTGPLVADIQRNRLSPYELVSTSVMNALLAAHNDPRVRRSRPGGPSLTGSYSVRALYRTGASVLRTTYPERTFASVEIAFADTQFPRFTHRLERSSARTTLAPLPWEPFPADVDSVGW